MANPHNSPWLKAYNPYLNDFKLKQRYNAIKAHTTVMLEVTEYNGVLRINKNIFVAKHSTKFRMLSHLDWAWYEPKSFTQAIETNTVDSYYEIMLNDIHSDPNVWKITDFEMELKSFYAARVKRASLI